MSLNLLKPPSLSRHSKEYFMPISGGFAGGISRWVVCPSIFHLRNPVAPKSLECYQDVLTRMQLTPWHETNT